MSDINEEFMDELMMDVWDGLKEEPNSCKKGYPAKKKKKKTEKQTQVSKGKFYNLMGLIQGEVMRMPEKNDVPATSEDQAMFLICFDLKKKNKNNRPTIRQGFKKIWNSWRKYTDHNGPKEYWVEEIKENKEEEFKMAEEKKMDLKKLVEEVNAQVEQKQVEEVVEEKAEENIEEEINMANNENKNVETAKEIEQEVAQTVAKKLANELMLHKADDSEIVIKANVIKNVDKDDKAINTRGKVMAFSEKLKKHVEIGSFVIGGGYSLPIFMIKCRGLKNETFKPVRDCDKENRMVHFHGSKNYFTLLSLLMSKEEIEAAKAAEIAHFFPPIRERSESKGVEKNLSVSVAINGESVSLTGWKQREWRPLYLENSDRTITVRWDLGKGYQDPSIKYNGKMLRKNHDGVSGTPEDVEIFEAIKDAIEDVLKG